MPHTAREIVATAVPEEPVTPEPTALEEPAPATAPSIVVVTGTAVRIDASGVEHAADDGTLTLHVRASGESERRDLDAHGGRFELEVSPRATLFVSTLVLGGRTGTAFDVRARAVRGAARARDRPPAGRR